MLIPALKGHCIHGSGRRECFAFCMRPFARRPRRFAARCLVVQNVSLSEQVSVACFLPCVRNLRMPWYTGLVWLGLRTGLRSPTPPNTYLSVVVPAPGSVSCCLCLSGSAAAALTSYVKRKPYGTGLCRSDPAADRHSHQVTIECKSHRSTLSCILHPWRLRGVLREHRPPGPAPIIMPVYIYSTTVASST